MIISHFPTAGGGGAAGALFDYTGEYEISTQGEDWEAKFFTSGTLTMRRANSVDIFLVGGGGAGGDSKYSVVGVGGSGYVHVDGGGGGGGGYVATALAQSVPRMEIMEIVIGAGGIAGTDAENGEATSIVSDHVVLTAAGGTAGALRVSGIGGNNGGSGAYGSYNGGDGQSSNGNATRAFGEAEGAVYSGGGGGGAGLYQSATGTVRMASGIGGAGGGGDGGTTGNGVPGKPNSGGGGGGGGGNSFSQASNLGGNGGSGILIMRNSR